MIIKPKWKHPRSVQSAITTNQGGFSENKFQSLNLSYAVGDNPVLVKKNLHKVTKELKLSSELLIAKQVHGEHVIEVTANNQEEIATTAADAIFTKETNIACGVLTADCLPILMCDSEGQAIACVHAGWKGLVKNVIENTITKFQDPQRIIAYIGPAISAQYFKVGQEVKELFAAKDKAYQHFFTTKNNDMHGNLKAIASILLQKSGLIPTNIFYDDYCTYGDNNFFSYRRDQGCTGRQASIIWIAKT